MPRYAITVNEHGTDAEHATTYEGRKDDARPLAKLFATAHFPGCTTAWSNDALLVKRDGAVIGCVSIDPAGKDEGNG